MSTLSSRVGLRASTTTLASFRKHAKQSVVNPHSSNFNSRRKSLLVSNGATISFVRDSVETSVPDVKLTKSRDGTSGTAFFTFENPDVFESATGDITGMYLSDEEGEMTTVSSCCLLYHLIARCVSYLKTSDVIASPFDSKSSHRVLDVSIFVSLSVSLSEPPLFSNKQTLFNSDLRVMNNFTQVDVNAKFVNGKPKCIEARYIMRSSQEWERFMRFMTRYAEDNGLGFNKTS